ncbi:MAG: hypothetical protein ACRDTR_01005 [Rubrobacter sp.]
MAGQGRRASLQRAAKNFCENADEAVAFAKDVEQLGKDRSVWAHDYAVIRLYRDFETLMLEALVGSINNDPSTLSANTGIDFPKHLTMKVCRFLVTRTGYFDFKGRSGLVRNLKQYVSEDHYLVKVVKKKQYRVTLDSLSALRNFAAHNSEQSRKAELEATGMNKLGSSGGWLRVNNRIEELSNRLKELAMEIHDEAPY